MGRRRRPVDRGRPGSGRPRPPATRCARAAGRVAAVLVTHDHEDHARGRGRVRARASARRCTPGGSTGAERLRDGAAVPGAGDAELDAVHTPGHSADHVAFFEPPTRALFTGDAVVGRGTSFIDPPDGDLTAYLASLQRMLELRPRTIYPGHGPVVVDAPAKLREYLTHRAEREERGARGPRRPATDGGRPGRADLRGLPGRGARRWPARSVTAHLLKLEREGRVRKSGRGGVADVGAPSSPRRAPGAAGRCAAGAATARLVLARAAAGRRGRTAQA